MLLIVAALEPDRLNDLIAGASDLGMDSLVEVHDEREIETAIDCGAEVLGINNRDLHSLEVDLGTDLPPPGRRARRNRGGGRVGHHARASTWRSWRRPASTRSWWARR